MRNRLDGVTFSGMVLNGYHSLLEKEAEINAMNVFPVADGDTGTNMRLTLENGINNAKKTKHLGEYLKDLSKGMLLGARGNSGVILSQIFKGMYLSLAHDGVANPGEIRDALISAYMTAYKAVVRPVEGTILTVAREGIENIKSQIYGRTQIANLFSMYLAEMRKSLANTPNMLPVLKSAGVVDSGAFGYITILDGMTKYLYGDKSVKKSSGAALPKTEVAATVDTVSSFNEDSEFKDGYCMEFLLQLMTSKHYKEVFNIKTYLTALKPLGESIVAIQEGSIVKVHIHTFSPAPIITLSQAFGEFVSFKLENMTLQHNETSKKSEKVEKPKKEFGIIAVVDGDGMENLYKDLGADIVLSGGKSMNTSSGEFKAAIEELNAETTVIMPNNPNTFEAANQAVLLSERKGVVVIPTKNAVEGYFALSMDLADAKPDYRIEMMKSGTDGLDVITVSTAVKDYSSDDFKCSACDEVGVLNGKMVAACGGLTEALLSAVKKIENIEDKTAFVVFLGKDALEKEDEICSALSVAYDDKEVQIICGGQSVYEIMVGVV